MEDEVEEELDMSKAWKELDEELLCPICLESYTEPKVLPCLHYYCKKCILKLSICSSNAEDPLVCPNCHVTVTLSPEDVEHLDAAFFIDRLLAAVLKLKVLKNLVEKCQGCIYKGPAQHFCRQCDCYICRVCLRAHCKMKVFSGHEVISNFKYSNELECKHDTKLKR